MVKMLKGKDLPARQRASGRTTETVNAGGKLMG